MSEFTSLTGHREIDCTPTTSLNAPIHHSETLKFIDDTLSNTNKAMNNPCIMPFWDKRSLAPQLLLLHVVKMRSYAL